MKRVNNLIENIAEPENLRLAFWKAKKGKTYSRQVQIYQDHLEANLLSLREQILSGLIQIGDYRYFKIFDPKERQICASAFSEQVLHHALMNICHAYFERVQVHDSYASRPEKGVHAAVKKAGYLTRKGGNWFLKIDIRKFFGSIHHDTLKTQLRRVFKDVLLLDIFDKIIDSYGENSGRGLPIGNLTSQYFANHYMASLDHYIKEELRIKKYIRYMDDLVIWHPDKQKLKHWWRIINEFVEIQLQLTCKPILLNKTDRGVPFCGYILFPNYTWLSRRSKKRYIKKIKFLDEQYHSGSWSEASCHRRAQSLIAFTRHADAVEFRKNVYAKHLSS